MTDLRGVKILITRPAHQADALTRRLLERGAEVVRFPAIEIKDCHRSEQNLARLHQLKRYQLLIFISRNAVEYGLKLLGADGGMPPLPPLAAIGRSTAERLEEHGLQVAACPAVPNSRRLLDTESVRTLPSGSRVLIFRGHGGKEVLADTLKRRGIASDYAEVYRRVKPQNRTLSLTEGPALVMVTSRDSLQNLYEMTAADSLEPLLDATLVLGTAAMADQAAALGFRRPPVIARSPLDRDMTAAALQWRRAGG